MGVNTGCRGSNDPNMYPLSLILLSWSRQLSANYSAIQRVDLIIAVTFSLNAVPGAPSFSDKWVGKVQKYD